MATQRHLEPARVKAIGQRFSQMAQILKAISGVLETQMKILQTTAFIGLVGGLAVERYLSIIKPRVDNLAKLCIELSEDAIKSAEDWERAQQSG
jgi:hypothetical protein